MKEAVKHFENELGNQIQIKIQNKDIEGVGGVLISIAGPSSDTEVHITCREAEIVYEQLGRVLRAD